MSTESLFCRTELNDSNNLQRSPIVKKKTSKKSTSKKSVDCGALTVGKTVMMRTAVYAWAGEVSRIFSIEGVGFVELTRSSWLANTGRYAEATKNPQTAEKSEIDFVDKPVLVQLASIGDVVEIEDVPERHQRSA